MSVENYQDLSTAQGGYGFLREMLVGVAYIIALPGFNVFFRHTFLGACGYIARLKHNGKGVEALTFIIVKLSTNQYREKGTFRWWHLMRMGMSIAQDYQLQNNIHLPLVEKLMRLTLTGPEPKVGYDAAYSLVGFSLWSFQVGDIKLAVFMIEQAIQADPMWGYPHYLLGWFGLFDIDVDSVVHFEDALNCNWSFFHRIMSDPICQRHPDILSRLRKRMVITPPHRSSGT
jgi:hypothetical protein